ncbi:MAG: arginase family protein [Proteobacteria bacterium]|nr:arginase family protein [Pseudomonadota bacterium]
MTLRLTAAPDTGFTSCLDFPVHTDLETLEGDVAILGIPYGAPYAMDQVASDRSRAPGAIRAQSGRIGDGLDRWDFDLGGPLFGRLLFDGREMRVDAHIDWRDEVNGVRAGYSSPIRRASEPPWFAGIFQIGIRGTGSARTQELRDAQAYGAEIVTAYQVHEAGMGAVLARIPDRGATDLTIDADGLDPSIMPAIEAAPARDANGISCITAGRLVVHPIGALARAG